MITIYIWKEILHSCYYITCKECGYKIENSDVALLIFFSIFGIIGDVILLPFEILIIIFKIILEFILNKEYRKWKIWKKILKN